MRSAIFFLPFVVCLAACGPKAPPATPGFRPPPGNLKAEAPSAGPNSVRDLSKGARAPDNTPNQIGQATWYGEQFAGKKTANGERFDPSDRTAAHRSLPFGTWVEVRRTDTGRMARVRINDRGPFGDPRRIIDVSRRSAEDLDMIRDGVVPVELRVVSGP